MSKTLGAGVQEVQLGRETYCLLRKRDYLRLLREVERSVGVDASDYARMSIGRDLRRKRQKAGMSQVEVARKSGLRVETLSRLENGQGNPTFATVRRILRALGEKV